MHVCLTKHGKIRLALRAVTVCCTGDFLMLVISVHGMYSSAFSPMEDTICHRRECSGWVLTHFPHMHTPLQYRQLPLPTNMWPHLPDGGVINLDSKVLNKMVCGCLPRLSLVLCLILQPGTSHSLSFFLFVSLPHPLSPSLTLFLSPSLFTYLLLPSCPLSLPVSSSSLLLSFPPSLPPISSPSLPPSLTCRHCGTFDWASSFMSTPVMPTWLSCESAGVDCSKSKRAVFNIYTYLYNACMTLVICDN